MAGRKTNKQRKLGKRSRRDRPSDNESDYRPGEDNDEVSDPKKYYKTKRRPQAFNTDQEDLISELGDGNLTNDMVCKIAEKDSEIVAQGEEASVELKKSIK